jgi:predicted Zn-dependent protease
LQLRNTIGVLIGLFLVFEAANLVAGNPHLLEERLHLGFGLELPVYAAFFLIFLAGFLPPAVYLFQHGLRQDLARRKDRRRDREAQSFTQRFRRAVDLEVDGQRAKAAEELENLLGEKPEDFATLMRYGEVLRLLGRADEALEVHRRASLLYPQSVALLYQLAADYEARGEGEVAGEVRNRILRDFPGQGLEEMRRRRTAAMAEARWDEALRWQDKIEALVQGSGDPALALREKEIDQGLAYQRGVGLLEADRAAEAGQVFRKLLQEEPKFVPASIMLGEAELLLENETAALEEWRRGFRATGSPVFLQRLEDYFIENEEPARAIESLQKLAGDKERDLLVRFFLGRLYYRLEMLDDSLRILESLRERLDLSPTYHYLIGRIRQRRDDLPLAAGHYQKALLRLRLPAARYLCDRCGAKHEEWQGRCSGCGAWSSIDLDLEDVQLAPEEAELIDRPVWDTSPNENADKANADSGTDLLPN